MKTWITTSVTIMTAMSLVMIAAAQAPTAKTSKRAKVPKFSKGEPFFDNALEQALVGERPNLGEKATVAGTPSPSESESSSANPTVSGWAAIVDASTLEDELKAQKTAAERNVTTPSDFAGKGHENSRRDFTMSAVVFGVIGQYDGDVRFKKEAPGLRDLFARAAANAKVGTQQAYAEAKLRRQDLADLIGGQSVKTPEGGGEINWSQVCNRSPLMKRLEIGYDEKIKTWSASPSAFKTNVEPLAHESQIFAVIATVLLKEEMEDASDDNYKAFGKSLLEGASAVSKACKENDPGAASKASSVIGKACVDCHQSYRG